MAHSRYKDKAITSAESRKKKPYHGASSEIAKPVDGCSQANTPVAYFDANARIFTTIKKEDALQVYTDTQMLPRWSTKAEVYVPEPSLKDQTCFLATLHLSALGFQYNLQRWLGRPSHLYIRGPTSPSVESLGSQEAVSRG